MIDHVTDGRDGWRLHRRAPHDLVLKLLLALSCGLILYLVQGKFGFYGDEGLNLLKAMMVDRGYALYRQVYSDQAPLYTWVLAGAMKLVDPDYRHMRMVPLLFGTIAVLGASAVAGRVAGRGASLACAALLLLWAPMLKFATAALITMPMLGFGVWSLYFALRAGAGRSPAMIVTSGLLLGSACLFKLGGVYFVLIVAPALLLGGGEGPAAHPLRTLGLWLAAALLPLVALAVACPLTALYSQLVAPHAVAFQQVDGQTPIFRRRMFLAPGMLPLYASALLALVVLLPGPRRRGAVLMALWLAVTTTWVLRIRPLWAHHFPDFLVALTVWLAVAAALAVAELRRGLRRRSAVVPVSMLVLLVAGAVTQVRSYGYWRQFYDHASEASTERVGEAIARAIPADGWVLPDYPMVAFTARRSVPPNLAVLNSKRISSGELTGKELCDALDTYRPLVVLCFGLLSRYDDFFEKVGREYQEVERIAMPTSFGFARQQICRLMRPIGGGAPPARSLDPWSPGASRRRR